MERYVIHRLLYISLHTERAGFIITEMYDTADASGIPVYLQAQCTADRGNTGIMTRYLSKGTYYLRFPENTYEVSVLLYPCKNQTWKSGSSVTVYNDYKHESDFTYKAPSNGYFTVSGKMLSGSIGSLCVVLCNSKGVPLTEKAVFSDLQNNKVTYAVKKGATYKLKTRGLNVNDVIYCQLGMKHTTISEKSGSTKKKAVAVKIGNKVSGTVLAEDSATKADWYKIKNPKKQQLLLNYTGSITSGSLMIDVYDAKGKKLDSYSVISNIGEKKDDLLHNKTGGTKMPEGTYYLKVTKSRKTSTGIYSFSMFGR